MSSADKDTALGYSQFRIAAESGLSPRSRYQIVAAMYRSPSGSSS